MRSLLIMLLANIVPIAFIALAAIFVCKETDGWGWCILCAVITKSSYTIESTETID